MQAGNLSVAEWLSTSTDCESHCGVGEEYCGQRTSHNGGGANRAQSANAGLCGGLRLPGPLGSLACDGCARHNADVSHPSAAGAAGEPLDWTPRGRRGVDSSSNGRRKPGFYVAAAAAQRHPTVPPSPRTPAPSLLPTVRRCP
jgi:hypothetical protein